MTWFWWFPDLDGLFLHENVSKKLEGFSLICSKAPPPFKADPPPSGLGGEPGLVLFIVRQETGGGEPRTGLEPEPGCRHTALLSSFPALLPWRESKAIISALN